MVKKDESFDKIMTEVNKCSEGFYSDAWISKKCHLILEIYANKLHDFYRPSSKYTGRYWFSRAG